MVLIRRGTTGNLKNSFPNAAATDTVFSCTVDNKVSSKERKRWAMMTLCSSLSLTLSSSSVSVSSLLIMMRRCQSLSFLFLLVLLVLYYLLKNSIQLIMNRTNSMQETLSVQMLTYIPLQPFHACNGQIEKIVCIETYLVGEGEQNNTAMIPYPIVETSMTAIGTYNPDSDGNNDNEWTNDTTIATNVVCNELLLQESASKSSSFFFSSYFYDSTPLFSSYAEVPICIQNGYDGTFGALAHYSSYPDTQTGTMREIRLVQEPQQSIVQPNNETAKLVQSYIRTSLFPAISESESISIRRIHRKRVDFPHHYKFISPNDWSIPEPSRDDNYGNMVWRYASHKMINPITINTNLYPPTIKYKKSVPLPDADALVLATANALQLLEQQSHSTKKDEKESAAQKLKRLVRLFTKRVMARNISTIVLGLGIQAEFHHVIEEEDPTIKTIPMMMQYILKNLTKNNSTTTNSTSGIISIANNKDSNTIWKLPYPYQVVFLKEVSVRSKKTSKLVIGVRGDVTEMVCRNSKVYNVCYSLGCPSLTISRDPNLGLTLQTKWNTLRTNLQQQLQLQLQLQQQQQQLQQQQQHLQLQQRQLQLHLQQQQQQQEQEHAPQQEQQEQQEHEPQQEQQQQKGLQELTAAGNNSSGMNTNGTIIIQKPKMIRIALATPGFHLNERIIKIVLELYCSILVRNGFDYSVTLIVQASSDKQSLKDYIFNVWNTDIEKEKNNNKNSNNSTNSAATTARTTIRKKQLKFKEFYNVESWLYSAANDYDLCISARIHGAMPFISSGIPVVVIPTDIRIMELVQAMHIPYILPTPLRENVLAGNRNNNSTDSNESGVGRQLILSLLQNAENTNFTNFEINRRMKIKGWKSILDKAEIEMDPSLLKLIPSPKRVQLKKMQVGNKHAKAIIQKKNPIINPKKMNGQVSTKTMKY